MDNLKAVIQDNPYYQFISTACFPQQLFVGESYTARYVLLNRFNLFYRLAFKTETPRELTLLNGSPIGKKERRELVIQLKPVTAGLKRFWLFLVASSVEKHWLVKESCQVQAKTRVQITGTIKNPLPRLLSLDQSNEVSFVFSNTGSRAVMNLQLPVQITLKLPGPL